MKLFFLTPFSFEKDLGRAYNEAIQYMPDDCWISVQDYDVMWTKTEIPQMEIMKRYIQKYPDTGLFTSYASRTKNANQKYEGGVHQDKDSLKYWNIKQNEQILKYGESLEIIDIPNEISGFHMIFSKETWKENPFEEGIGCLSVDNRFAWGIHRLQKPVRLMKALLAIHFYRLDTDITDISHLK